jgi:putative transposase
MQSWVSHLSNMPMGLVRYHQSGNFHFLTFSCNERQPLLGARAGYGIFERELERVRRRHSVVVAGYVVMLEHVHLLISEPRIVQLSATLQV